MTKGHEPSIRKTDPDEEELPDLFVLWSQECSHDCKDMFNEKNSSNKSPLSPRYTEVVDLHSQQSTESTDSINLLRKRSEDLHEDISSQPGPNGEDTSCQAGSSSYIVNREVFSLNDSPGSIATGKKTSSARETDLTYGDPSILENGRPARHNSKDFYSKGELAGTDPHVNQAFDQGSSSETNKPSCNGIILESRRQDHDGNGVPPSLALNTATRVTPKRSTSTDGSQCVSNCCPASELDYVPFWKQGQGHHHVSNFDRFSPYKDEDIEIGETFMCTEQTPYWSHFEENSTPKQGCDISVPTDLVNPQSIEYSMHTSADRFQGYVESEAEKSSDRAVILPPQTFTKAHHNPVDQTSLDGFDICHRGGSPVAENENVTSEHSHFARNEDSETRHVSKDPCYDALYSSSGYDSECEIILDTTAVKPIKMRIKKIGGNFKCYLLGESHLSVGSRPGTSSHRRRNNIGDESCMESDSDDPNVEKYCIQFTSKINNLRMEKQEMIMHKQKLKEQHLEKMKALKEEYKGSRIRLERRQRDAMKACSLEIQAITRRIDDQRKYLLEGQKLLQDMLPL